MPKYQESLAPHGKAIQNLIIRMKYENNFPNPRNR